MRHTMFQQHFCQLFPPSYRDKRVGCRGHERGQGYLRDTSASQRSTETLLRQQNHRKGSAFHPFLQVWSPDWQVSHHLTAHAKFQTSRASPHLLTQNCQGCRATYYILTHPPGDFNTLWSMRTTAFTWHDSASDSPWGLLQRSSEGCPSPKIPSWVKASGDGMENLQCTQLPQVIWMLCKV